MPPINGVLETFTSALGANWTTPAGVDTGTGSVSGGEFVPAVANTTALYTGLGALADAEAFVTVPVLPAAGNDVRLKLRCDVATLGAQNEYLLRVVPSTTTWTIRKRISGVLSTIATESATALLAGDKLWFYVIGTNLYGYRYTSGSWTLVLSATDSDISDAGYIGLAISDDTQTARFDDFGGGAAIVLDQVLPDADVVTTGWSTAPLYSKINDSSDATVIQATAV